MQQNKINYWWVRLCNCHHFTRNWFVSI